MSTGTDVFLIQLSHTASTMKTAVIFIFCVTSSALGFSLQDGSAGRRDFLSSVGGALTGAAVVAPSNALVRGSAPQGTALGKVDKNSAVGKEIESWNSLIKSFKNNRLDGGLDASKLNEPSIPFTEFGEKLKNGEVTLVEFMAPNGDVAYATIKTGKGKGKNAKTKRIRYVDEAGHGGILRVVLPRFRLEQISVVIMRCAF